MEQQGLVFNIQRFSTDDGTGIRTCVFLKGCPLHCQWCHNPESLRAHRELACHQQNCIGCGACVAACPKGAVRLADGKCQVDRDLCNCCGACTEACACDALVMVGKTMTVEQVMSEVRRDIPFYAEDGGMTITGGEPMLQPEFTIALAAAAKQEGMDVALETSGWGKTEDFVRLTDVCDLFLFDCKASSARHKELTGVEDTLILKNLDAICAVGANVILRVPIVPGGNLEDTFLEKVAGLAKKYRAIQHVQLMPYHKLGLSKTAVLGCESQREFSVPDRELLPHIAQKIQSICGKEVAWT